MEADVGSAVTPSESAKLQWVPVEPAQRPFGTRAASCAAFVGNYLSISSIFGATVACTVAGIMQRPSSRDAARATRSFWLTNARKPRARLGT